MDQVAKVRWTLTLPGKVDYFAGFSWWMHPALMQRLAATRCERERLRVVFEEVGECGRHDLCGLTFELERATTAGRHAREGDDGAYVLAARAASSRLKE
jgi:hypothetical protein